MFLHQPGERIQIACPDVRGRARAILETLRAQPAQRRQCPLMNLARDRRQFLSPLEGVNCIEIFAGGRCVPRTIDEVSEAVAMALQPGLALLSRSSSGAGPYSMVTNFLNDAHVDRSILWSSDNSSRSYAMG